MEPLSSFDLISVVLILFSGFFAYLRGFIKEVLLILNWILAIVVAYFVSPQIFVSISEIEFIMRILGDSCELMMILSFLLGFTLALIAISFVTYRISYLIETSIFNEINKIFGLLFGFLRGGIIVIIFLIIYNQALKDTVSWSFIGLSKSNTITLAVQEKILTQYPQNIPEWIINNYDNLLTSCVKK
jgi:membrane protein required for colicin V production